MNRHVAFFTLLMLFSAVCVDKTRAGNVEDDIQQLDLVRGIVAVVGVPADDPDYLVKLCKGTQWTIFFQTDDQGLANEARKRADEAGLLGTRLFIELGPMQSLHLRDDVADRVLVSESAQDLLARREILRALSPRGVAVVGEERWIKPVPEGTDDWTHPYHGPDNNPQSEDKLVHGSLRTQFIGYPNFSPMPEQTVIAGGRIYKAMGHIAHKANQNEMLNTLLCIHAYNGTILWRRPLPQGFMLHRNTMIATDDALYMGDHESCKIIHGETGEIDGEIRVDQTISDGPVWKWMAMQDGILYALVGNSEVKIETQRAIRRGLGHWPWGMWKGHDYKDPRTSFGFGRTLVAIDIKTNKRLWHYRDDEFLDARAVCMNDREIYCYCPGKFIAAIDRNTGKQKWRNTDEKVLAAIAGNEKAQHYLTGYATTCYMKCNDQYLFFAGPQRSQMVVLSAGDGSLAWTYPDGNLQLVLREDAVWAVGSKQSTTGFKFDYASGDVLATFPGRRACTRATGCQDSIFFRAEGGTLRVFTETRQAQHFDPMRPPCQDGVLIAGGHLYWGPWMCGCQLSLYGNIGLKPETTHTDGNHQERRVTGDLSAAVEPIHCDETDWSTYRGNNARTDLSQVAIARTVERSWAVQVCHGVLPTAPVTAGERVFVADRSGAVRAFDKQGLPVWTAYTGGPISYPPTVAHDRLFVGSADGRVYAYAAQDGRFLWSYRVGPSPDRIPVYDRLISSWPVAGGVVVQGDTVYAVAGITHYDGTHVVALDAFTGQLQESNSASGTLKPEVNNGVSLQGNLRIVDGELRFLAGGVYETARYDLKTLRCLNTPKFQLDSKYRTAFYSYYPSYGKYVSLDYQCNDGCLLSHDASYEGSQFDNLMRLPATANGVKRPPKEAARWIRRGVGKLPQPIWKDRKDRRFTSFAITEKALLATGHPEHDANQAFLVSIDPSSGTEHWIKRLPSGAVKGGTSIDRHGRIFIALENGQLLCYEMQQANETE